MLVDLFGSDNSYAIGEWLRSVVFVGTTFEFKPEVVAIPVSDFQTKFEFAAVIADCEDIYDNQELVNKIINEGRFYVVQIHGNNVYVSLYDDGCDIVTVFSDKTNLVADFGYDGWCRRVESNHY